MATSTNPPTASPAPAHPGFDTSKVAGNAPEEIKRILGDPRTFFASFLKPGQRPLNGFGKEIMERMIVTELAIVQKAEEPQRLEGRAVLEVDVSEGTRRGDFSQHQNRQLMQERCRHGQRWRKHPWRLLSVFD